MELIRPILLDTTVQGPVSRSEPRVQRSQDFGQLLAAGQDQALDQRSPDAKASEIPRKPAVSQGFSGSRRCFTMAQQGHVMSAWIVQVQGLMTCGRKFD